ncbi:hypothetical protein BJX70DRAFT_161006 [Aspergillus crustosus]
MMPALIGPNSENRRPRRSSITQQLQRMFKAGEGSGSNEDPSSTAPYHSAPSGPPMTDNSSGDYANHGPSEISSFGYSRHSHSSLASKVTGLNTSESRRSSLRSFQLEHQQPAKTSSDVDSSLQKLASDTSPTADHTFVQKQDRRATRRLEAERLELEKRLLKLEEAERTGDVSVLRRESRRLTKKQPFGSSSRSSSTSGEESRSRPSSRLSSLFSSARRRSRSRSMSSFRDGFDDATGYEEALSMGNSDALPALSSTLPERLSNAISKELAARKNALLVSTENSSQTPKLPQPKNETGITPVSSSQSTFRHGKDVASALVSTTSENRRNEEGFSPETKRHDYYQKADLDRALFTASLTSNMRGSASSQPGRNSMPDSEPTQCDVEVEKILPGIQVQTQMNTTEASPRKRTAVNPRRGSPMIMLTRASEDGVLQRHQKTFKSSPLAESQTVNGEDVSPAPKKATALATFQVQDMTTRSIAQNVTERATWSELGVTSSPSVQQTANKTGSELRLYPLSIGKPSGTESKSARAFKSKIPTSKPNHPSGTQTQVTATLAPLRRERDLSPEVPPKSPKRNSRALSQSPDPLPGNRIRPNSGLSLGPSQDSESDYNTADEAASIKSRASEDHDLSASAKPALAVDSTRIVLKKTVVSSIDGARGTKIDTKKPTRKMRPVGRDQHVAKLFVICCRCKFWHDMPSEVYASLTVSDPLSAALDQELAAWERNALSDRLTTSTIGTPSLHESAAKSAKSAKSELQQKALRARVTTDLPSGPVICCWCEHHMSKQCCQGWTTAVQMRQRHH